MKKKDVVMNNTNGIKSSSLYLSFKNLLGVLLSLAVMCVFISIIEPNFSTVDNLLIILRNSSVNAMIAFGMTFVILMGGIDLSVPGVMASAGMLSTLLLKNLAANIGPDPSLFTSSQTFGIVAVSILAGVALGAGIGFFNGTFSTKFKIAPFIVTLATAYITKGFALFLTKGSVVTVTVQQYNDFGNGMVGGVIPVQIVYMVIVFVIMFIVLNKTKYGRKVYAIGGNEQAARYSGIRVDRIKISSYTILGILGAFGGILTCARLNSGQPTIGTNGELDAIAATILGGTSFTGGVGTLTGTLIGAIMLYVIQNGLNLMGVDQFWQPMAKGTIILIAVYIDMLKYRKNK